MKNVLLVTATIALALVLVVNVVLLIAMPASKVGTAAPVAAPAAAAPRPVTLTVVTQPSCTDCFDPGLYIPELEKLGVAFGKTTNLTGDSLAGKRLIAKYGLTRLPALVFSEELGGYSTIADAWSRVGTIDKDGSYILQGSNPPYYEIADRTVHGVVSLTILSDAACTQCYDPAIHRQILQQYGVAIGSDRTVDISGDEGKALVAQYGIVAVPTALIDGELGLYPGMADLWSGVGKVQDGVYVFTNLAAVGEPYRDLSTGQMVVPAQPTATG